MTKRIGVTFVIMAGGRGERLWPLVRAARPKVCLSPDGKRSLLQATVDRLRPAWPGAKWLVVTTREQAESVRASLPPELRRSVLCEPSTRNTAACMTLAAATLAVRDPRQIMVAAPADHWVGDPAAFRRSVRAAIRAARSHQTIATIGIRPTHPHPGLGYLCAGEPVRGAWGARVFRLTRFVEKPTHATARRLLVRSRGNGRATYWNSGIFVAAADTVLERVTEWLPEHTRRLVPLVNGHRAAWSRNARRAYRTLKAISFDHGVMDHLSDGLVVEGRFPWADLGSWSTWAQLSANSSRVLTLDSQQVTAVSQEPHLIAAIGVRNLLVVHTPTATLICPPSRVQAVRELVRRLSRDPRLAAYR